MRGAFSAHQRCALFVFCWLGCVAPHSERALAGQPAAPLPPERAVGLCFCDNSDDAVAVTPCVDAAVCAEVAKEYCFDQCDGAFFDWRLEPCE